MTAPFRVTTQTCVSAIETSRPAKYSMVGPPLPMTEPILSASAKSHRPLPDVEKRPFSDVRFSGRPVGAAFKKSAGGPANLSIGQRARSSAGLRWCWAAMFHRIAFWRVFVTLDFSTFSTSGNGRWLSGKPIGFASSLEEEEAQPWSISLAWMSRWRRRTFVS